jgi:hypothetical protein
VFVSVLVVVVSPLDDVPWPLSPRLMLHPDAATTKQRITTIKDICSFLFIQITPPQKLNLAIYGNLWGSSIINYPTRCVNVNLFEGVVGDYLNING